MKNEILCPWHGPISARMRESIPPGAEQQPTQSEIAHEVASLSYQKVPGREVSRVDAKEKVQQGIKYPACIVGRGEIA